MLDILSSLGNGIKNAGKAIGGQGQGGILDVASGFIEPNKASVLPPVVTGINPNAQQPNVPFEVGENGLPVFPQSPTLSPFQQRLQKAVRNPLFQAGQALVSANNTGKGAFLEDLSAGLAGLANAPRVNQERDRLERSQKLKEYEGLLNIQEKQNSQIQSVRRQNALDNYLEGLSGSDRDLAEADPELFMRMEQEKRLARFRKSLQPPSAQQQKLSLYQEAYGMPRGDAIKAIMGDKNVLSQYGLIDAPEADPFKDVKIVDGRLIRPDGQGGFIDATPSNPNSVDELTIGEEAVDKAFAKDFAKDFAGGGISDSYKQLEQLKEVSESLASGDNLTGPITGRILNTVTNPKGVAQKEQVEEVVQRNLREVLGAQFTEKEGERLISRAYNPKLSEAENKKRVDRLYNQMSLALEQKQEASDYFRTNGTLKGFKGKLPSISDFENALESDNTTDDLSIDDQIQALEQELGL